MQPNSHPLYALYICRKLPGPNVAMQLPGTCQTGRNRDQTGRNRDQPGQDENIKCIYKKPFRFHWNVVWARKHVRQQSRTNYGRSVYKFKVPLEHASPVPSFRYLAWLKVFKVDKKKFTRMQELEISKAAWIERDSQNLFETEVYCTLKLSVDYQELNEVTWNDFWTCFIWRSAET